MTLNRKTVTVALATLGLMGVTGGGIAWASANAPTSSTADRSTLNCAGRDGMVYGKYSPMSAVADYLGLTRTELIDRMRSGNSLADIARTQGKTVAGVKSTMLSVLKHRLAEDTDLTSAQRTVFLAMMQRHLDAMVHGTGMGGMDADDMHAMMGDSGMMRGAKGGMMGGPGHGSRGFGNGMMGN